MNRSPLMIKIILHYMCDAHGEEQDYAQGTPHGSSPAVREIMIHLVTKGILKPTGPISPEMLPKRPWYEANFDACFAYLDALCEVPLPVLKWVVPKFSKEISNDGE